MLDKVRINYYYVIATNKEWGDYMTLLEKEQKIDEINKKTVSVETKTA